MNSKSILSRLFNATLLAILSVAVYTLASQNGIAGPIIFSAQAGALPEPSRSSPAHAANQENAAESYTLTVIVNGSGSVVKVPDQDSYATRQIVTLRADPSPDSSFAGWSGDLWGTANPRRLIMTRDKTVTATFTQNDQQGYSLSVATNGAGSVQKVPDKESYTSGEVITLTPIPETGWSFFDWSGDLSGSSNPASLTMDGDKSVTANFAEDQFSLSISTNGSGSVSKDPDQENYGYGETVSLTASPAPGWNFTGWAGDLSGSANPATLTIDGNKSVTANFTPNQYTLAASSNGSGSITKDPDKTAYQHGETVSLTASPAPGWNFTGWTGDLSGSANPASLTMDGNKQVTANFAPVEYTLTTSVTGSGSLARNPDKPAYQNGEQVTLTASADPGWSFSHWSGDLSGSSNPVSTSMDKNKTVTANFIQEEHNLITHVEGDGEVSKNPNKPSYTYGEQVILTAHPETGWEFSGWEGDLSGTNNPVTITIDSDRVVTARFSLFDNLLTIQIDGNGYVTKNPDKPAYNFWEEVELEAFAGPGWRFAYWSGDLFGDENPAEISMSRDKTVIAHFTQDAFALNTGAVGQGTVSKDPDKSGYLMGEEVTLTAAPAAGWSFSYWSGDIDGSDNPETITIEGNTSVTANFSRHQPAGLSLSSTSLAENQPPGTAVGAFSTADPDADEEHSYNLVSGEGSGDNGFFSISGSTLLSDSSFDYESKNQYSIRVRVTDRAGLYSESTFTISVTNVNEAPSGLDDPYSVSHDTELSVPAPGVLANDSDPDQNPLTAALSSGPQNAQQFQLNADGSFTYRPKNGFTGLDSFTYLTSDGTMNSNPVKVEIEVLDASSPQIEWTQPVGTGKVYEISEGRILLVVDAQDDVAVQRVHFYWWNATTEEFVVLGDDYEAPFELEVSASELNTGWNQVFARAYDSAGNESGRSWIWVKVSPIFRIFLPGLFT